MSSLSGWVGSECVCVCVRESYEREKEMARWARGFLGARALSRSRAAAALPATRAQTGHGDHRRCARSRGRGGRPGLSGEREAKGRLAPSSKNTPALAPLHPRPPNGFGAPRIVQRPPFDAGAIRANRASVAWSVVVPHPLPRKTRIRSHHDRFVCALLLLPRAVKCAPFSPSVCRTALRASCRRAGRRE